MSFCFFKILLCGLMGRQTSLFSRFSFLWIIIKSGRRSKISWSVCISKSQRDLCDLFSRTNYGLFVWSNLIFLHNSRWITFPTQSCLILYYFCDYYYFTLLRVFPPALANGFLLEFEWQQVSSSFQDSSQYSGWS